MSKPIRKHTRANHPAQRLDHKLQKVFGQVFEDIGGTQRMQTWAEDNYTEFMKLYVRLAPRPQVEINTGKVEIRVHPSLQHSPLDGEYERKE